MQCIIKYFLQYITFYDIGLAYDFETIFIEFFNMVYWTVYIVKLKVVQISVRAVTVILQEYKLLVGDNKGRFCECTPYVNSTESADESAEASKKATKEEVYMPYRSLT